MSFKRLLYALVILTLLMFPNACTTAEPADTFYTKTLYTWNGTAWIQVTSGGGPPGPVGPQGNPGTNGLNGPNLLDNNTNTTFSGLVTGNGTKVGSIPIPVACYGQLWTDASPGNTITVTSAGTYYTYLPQNVGLTNQVTGNLTTGTLTVVDTLTRIYRVSLVASCKTSHPGASMHWTIYVNNVLHNEISSEQAFSATDIGTVAAIGMIQLAHNDVITMRVTSDFAGDIITVNHASLNINSIDFGS